MKKVLQPRGQVTALEHMPTFATMTERQAGKLLNNTPIMLADKFVCVLVLFFFFDKKNTYPRTSQLIYLQECLL